MIKSLQQLKLDEKFSPIKNPDISWFYVFLIALFCYLNLLTNFINHKPEVGLIESYSPSLIKYISDSAKIQVLSTGHTWTEGPLWIDADSSGYLIFGDTIANQIFKWEEGKGFFTVGKSLLIDNSGCKANLSLCHDLHEPGSNGVVRLPPTSVAPDVLDLLVCQHGERAISLIRENGKRQLIATHYKNKRLNSPNDLILSPEGNLYFTDPKFGLVNQQGELIESELAHSGVYLIRAADLQESVETGLPTTRVTLLVNDLTAPNGLAFSPDFSVLYVANSNKQRPLWIKYGVAESGKLENGKIFFDGASLLAPLVAAGAVGMPDGIKIDIHGNMFAAGPGGVLIISPEGLLLGRIALNQTVSNLAFSADGHLYITASDSVLRVKTNTKPARSLTLK